MGGELVSCSKISLSSVHDADPGDPDTTTDGENTCVEEGRDKRVGVESEEGDKSVGNKKDENAAEGENNCEDERGEEGERETEEDGNQHREKLGGNCWLWGMEDSKRSKLGGSASKMNQKFEENDATERRSRSESNLLSDLSR